MKPGSAGPAALGIYPVIWDENGKELKAGAGTAGNICIRNPWPGIMQTIWGSPERFVDAVLQKILQGSEQQGLARLAVLRRGRRRAARRRLLPHSRPRR